MKLAKYLSYGAMAALILMMMAATFVEKISGTPVAFRWVYHNPVFLILWAVAAVGGLVFLFQRGVHRKLFTMGIHVGLVVILAGALVTYLSGTSGSIHLREGETSEVFELEDGTTAALPFGIGLDRFVIDYYPDSRMPSDYTSYVVFRPEGKAVRISMNHIAKYRGYRFYQADYDDDGKGSVLAVSHDPWGVGITYAGYLLLLVSMMGFFFEKQTPFRGWPLLRSPWPFLCWPLPCRPKRVLPRCFIPLSPGPGCLLCFVCPWASCFLCWGLFSSPGTKSIPPACLRPGPRWRCSSGCT